MDIQYIEKACRMFFEFCCQNPELCPHDFSWIGTRHDYENKISFKKYKCNICGKEEVIKENF